jgi:hypothetical protein
MSKHKQPNDASVAFVPLSLLTADGSGWTWAARWTIVFALNLIVPLLLGWDMMRLTGGRDGLILATAMLWATGFWIGWRTRDGRFVLLTGGIFVALTQFYPILQVMAAIAGWCVARGIIFSWFPPGSEIHEFAHTRFPLSPGLHGFTVTIITGGLLIVAAIVLGWVAKPIAKLAGWRRKH